MHSPSKDYLSDTMKESRVTFADNILERFPRASWWSHVAIDPCISILASSEAQSQDQKIAAMGKMKMMSPKSRFKGANTRAPSTAKTQGRTGHQFSPEGKCTSMCAMLQPHAAMPVSQHA